MIGKQPVSDFCQTGNIISGSVNFAHAESPLGHSMPSHLRKDFWQGPQAAFLGHS